MSTAAADDDDNDDKVDAGEVNICCWSRSNNSPAAAHRVQWALMQLLSLTLGSGGPWHGHSLYSRYFFG